MQAKTVHIGGFQRPAARPVPDGEDARFVRGAMLGLELSAAFWIAATILAFRLIG